MQMIAFLTDELSIQRILDHIGLSTPPQATGIAASDSQRGSRRCAQRLGRRLGRFPGGFASSRRLVDGFRLGGRAAGGSRVRNNPA